MTNALNVQELDIELKRAKQGVSGRLHKADVPAACGTKVCISLSSWLNDSCVLNRRS